MNTTTQGCTQTATTICISVPSHGLRGVQINYTGRGTQVLDATIVGIVLVTLLVALLGCVRMNTR